MQITWEKVTDTYTLYTLSQGCHLSSYIYVPQHNQGGLCFDHQTQCLLSVPLITVKVSETIGWPRAKMWPIFPLWFTSKLPVVLVVNTTQWQQREECIQVFEGWEFRKSEGNRGKGVNGLMGDVSYGIWITPKAPRGEGGRAICTDDIRVWSRPQWSITFSAFSAGWNDLHTATLERCAWEAVEAIVLDSREDLPKISLILSCLIW